MQYIYVGILTASPHTNTTRTQQPGPASFHKNHQHHHLTIFILLLWHDFVGSVQRARFRALARWPHNEERRIREAWNTKLMLATMVVRTKNKKISIAPLAWKYADLETTSDKLVRKTCGKKHISFACRRILVLVFDDVLSSESSVGRGVAQDDSLEMYRGV